MASPSVSIAYSGRCWLAPRHLPSLGSAYSGKCWLTVRHLPTMLLAYSGRCWLAARHLPTMLLPYSGRKGLAWENHATYLAPLSGKTKIRSYERWLWLDDSDWSTFTGAKRQFQNVMALAFQNMGAIPGLNIANRIVHYRWGAYHNHLDRSGHSNTAVAKTNGTLVLGFCEDGLKAANVGVGSGAAYIEPSLLADQWASLLDRTTANHQSLVISFWAKPNGTYQRLFGVSTQSLTGENDWASATLSLDDARKLGCWFQGNTGDYVAYSGSTPTQLTDNKLVHVLVHVFPDTATNKWRMRFFLDGKFAVEGASSGNLTSTSRFTWNSVLYDAVQPYFFARAQQVVDYTHYIVLNDTEPENGTYGSFKGMLDEAMVARCHPALDGGGNPITGIAPWTAGQQVFRVTRHPDPAVVTDENAFTIYSPVQVTNLGVARINWVCVMFDTPGNAAGQQVWMSMRAGSVDDLANDRVSWSDWTQMTSGAWLPTPAGGRGEAMQLRLKALPSTYSVGNTDPATDDRCYYCPQIWAVRYKAQEVTFGEAEEHLEAMIDIQGHAPDIGGFEAKVIVLRDGYDDLASKVNVAYASQDIVLDSIITVTSLAEDLPCKITVQRSVDETLWSKIMVIRETADVDLPAKIDIIANYQDLSCAVTIYYTVDLPSQITVDAVYLTGSILVQQPGYNDLSARCFILLETPGSCAPVVPDIDGGGWTQEPRRTFRWQAASYVNHPITGYYCLLSKTAGEIPDADTWQCLGPNVLSKSLDLSQYGQGHWYFYVAAKNDIGGLGPAAWAEARYSIPPTRPGAGWMRINQVLDCLGNVPPLVSRRPESAHALWWSPSVDLAGATYRIEIATRADFGINPQTGLSSLVRLVENCPDNILNLTPSLESERYFWRIQAWDDELSSEWSPVGVFDVNYPPGVPAGISVNQS